MYVAMLTKCFSKAAFRPVKTSCTQPVVKLRDSSKNIPVTECKKTSRTGASLIWLAKPTLWSKIFCIIAPNIVVVIDPISKRYDDLLARKYTNELLVSTRQRCTQRNDVFFVCLGHVQLQITHLCLTYYLARDHHYRCLTSKRLLKYSIKILKFIRPRARQIFK
jgi:hypothetical protein